MKGYRTIRNNGIIIKSIDARTVLRNQLKGNELNLKEIIVFLSGA